MKYVVPLLVACFACPLQCCVAKPKPFDGMTIVALKTPTARSSWQKSISHPVNPKADADAVHRAKAEINGVRRKFRSGTILAPATQRGVEVRLSKMHAV